MQLYGQDLKGLRENLRDKTVYVIPYCHADVAWVHSRAWHVNRYVRVLDEALDIMGSNPRFCYFIDSWTEMLRPYLEHRPHNRERIARLLSEGRLALCGGHYGNLRMTNVGNETAIRNITMGLERVRERFPGFQPVIYSNLDVGIGHSQVPQVMKLGGFKGYFGWRPQAGLDAQGVPRSFIWQGLSGDHIQVCRFCYSGLNATPQGRWGDDWDETLQLLAPELEKNAAQKGVSAVGMCMGADDSRPLRRCGDDEPNVADELIEAWNRDGMGTMRYGTPEHLFEHLAADELPVAGPVLDQAEVCYNLNVSGHRGLWWWREKGDRALVEAELYYAIACLRGAPSRQKMLEAAWEDLLEICPHAQQFLFRRDEEQKYELGRRAVRSAEQVSSRSLESLLPACLPLDSTHLALINPVPQEGRRLVRTVIPNSDRTLRSFKLFDDEGVEIPYQLRELIALHDEYDIEFYADLVPCGFRTVRLVWSKQAPATPESSPLPLDTIVEHKGLRVVFGGGLMRRIEDAESGLAWEADAESSFLEPRVYPYTGGTWLPDSLSQQARPCMVTELRQEDCGPVCARVSRLVSAGQNVFRQEIAVDGNAREIRVATTTKLCEEQIYVGIGLPTDPGAALTVDIPFGVESRLPDEIPYCAPAGRGHENIERRIPGYFWGRSWLDASTESKGTALLSEDGDRYYWRHPSEGYIVHFLTRVPCPPEKGWEARTPLALAQGMDCWRHTLVLHQGDYRAAGVVERAQMLRFPVRALPVRIDGDGASESWLSVSPKAVRLSAFYVKGDVVVLRVYNASSEAQQAEVMLPRQPAEAVLVDFHLNPLEGCVDLCGRRLVFGLKPWQVATARLHF